jgi:hypothetical protein
MAFVKRNELHVVPGRLFSFSVCAEVRRQTRVEALARDAS